MAYTTIDDPEAHFQTKLYTGNGSADHAITLDGDTDMQPDFVWIKNRDATDPHIIFDSVRGATQYFEASGTLADTDDNDTLDSFTSDGFQVDADVKVNTNTEKYVAWCWKEAAAAGLDIVAWDGNGANRNLSHNLSAIPTFMIVKRLDDNNNTEIYHQALGNTHHMYLNETNATTDDADRWNDTTPTSSVFTVSTQIGVNASGSNYIGYIFADVQGFSKFGSYVGNGGTGTDGPFVYTGMKPSFVMIKKASAVGSWLLFDNKRASTSNIPEGTTGVPSYLEPNTTGTEQGDNPIFLYSNGFQCLDSLTNTNGANYIFMAFAEAPFVNSKGVPCNAR